MKLARLGSRVRHFVCAAVAAAGLLSSGSASAQKWVTSGLSEGSSGIEGGGGRAQTMNRAATRLRIGAELYVDENPDDAFAGAILFAVEPRTAFGVDGRYTRAFGKFAASAGVIAYLQPGSLVGPVAAFELRLPLSKSFLLTAGPEVNVLVLGSDLPDRTIIWQGLFHVGARITF